MRAQRLVPVSLIWLCLAGWLHAEPCFVGFQDERNRGPDLPADLVRTGVQRTFLFHRGGLQDIVVRPSFTGRVDEFGMVLPFPVAPAVRKVDGAFFSQLDRLLDPQPRSLADPDADVLEAESVQADSVRVIREEVVGMYQVATLEAGSSEALIKWLDEHSYRYPPAMGPICEEYVARGWVFVVVKVDLTASGAVAPRPGMRDVQPGLAAGSAFSGPVQGMGFRFGSEELVLSAKLASLNDRSQMTSRLYVLADAPGRFSQLDPGLVRERLTGAELLGRAPLAGTSSSVFDQLLSSIHAANTGETADSAEWKAHRTELTEDLRGMSLTVIEGELPKDVLREHDLVFTGEGATPVVPAPAGPPVDPAPTPRGQPGAGQARPEEQARLGVGGAIVTILLALAFGAVLMRETRSGP